MYIKHLYILQPFIISACVIALGFIVLLGWQLNNEYLYSVIQGLPPMVPNTALGFIFAGGSLWLLSGREVIPYRIYAGQLLAVMSALIGVITIIEYLNIMPMITFDRLLVPLFSKEPFVLRPSPLTAFAFTFTGITLFLLGSGKTQLVLLIQWISLIVLIFTIVVILGYIYGEIPFHTNSDVIGMAVHTAIGFCLLSLGILMTKFNTGLMRNFTSNTAGGIVMRRLLPAIVLVPLILGWLIIIARKEGLHTEPFGMALLQSLNIFVMTIIVFRVITVINREERLKQNAEDMARQHQAKLAHLDRLNTMNQMSTGIAHEINQPLTAISIHASACQRMLNNHKDVPEEIMISLEKIASSTNFAAEIIKRMREFVRNQTPNKSFIELNDLISNAIQYIDYDMRSNNVHLKILAGEELPKIDVDAVQIEQVLLNIIRNSNEALQAESVTDKHITISTYINKNNNVQIDICDSGPGMDKETVEHLFEPFFTTKGTEGMGVGLFICQSIIEAHGGQLWVKSSQGQGTCFSISLPKQK